MTVIFICVIKLVEYYLPRMWNCDLYFMRQIFSGENKVRYKFPWNDLGPQKRSSAFFDSSKVQGAHCKEDLG